MGRGDVLRVGDKWQRTAADVINGLGTSGTYTLVLTPVLNVASSSPSDAQYFRFLDRVFVCGYFGVDPTATGLTKIGISLAVASNIGSLFDVGGVAQSDTFTQGGAITGDSTNKRAELAYQAVNAGNAGFGFFFAYRVL